jgi:hypothetical protein
MILSSKGSYQPCRIDFECKHASIFGKKNKPFTRAHMHVFRLPYLWNTLYVPIASDIDRLICLHME